MLKYRINKVSAIVPNFSGRYLADICGRILDTFTGDDVDTSGDYVNLLGSSWEKPSVDFIVAMTFKPIDKYLLDYVTVDYIDPALDRVPENMYWVFPEEGVECPHFPGFYFIPSFTNYLISREGVIISRFNGEIKEIHLSGSGYYSVRMTRDDGVGQTQLVHRLLASTFLSPPPNADEMEVNHIDLDRTNNDLTNLEWVTKLQNMQHAMLMRNRFIDPTIRMMDIYTEEVRVFPNMATIAKEFNVSNSHIWQAVKMGRDIALFKDRYVLMDGRREFPDDLSKLKSADRNNGKPKRVRVNHVQEGRSEEFNSVMDVLRKYKNVTKKQVYTILKDGSERVVGGMQFSYI